MEGLSKKEKDSWAWTTGWWLLWGEGIRGLNGNGKTIIMTIKSKINFKKRTSSYHTLAMCSINRSY